jgi:hypothetical protein
MRVLHAKPYKAALKNKLDASQEIPLFFMLWLKGESNSTTYVSSRQESVRKRVEQSQMLGFA